MAKKIRGDTHEKIPVPEEVRVDSGSGEEPAVSENDAGDGRKAARSKRIRDGTAQKEPAAGGAVQLSDIILILDRIEYALKAVSKIGADGKAKTVPADEEHRNSFLKIDRQDNFFNAAWNNFRSQYLDPTRWGIFKMPEKDLEKHREAVEDLAAGKKTDAVAAFLEKYEVKLKDASKEQNINDKNSEKMATENQTQGAAADDRRKPRFNESMIDWDQLKKFGLARDFLQEKGLLDSMMRGYKSNQTVPVTMNFGSVVLRTDARLSFQQSTGGPVVLGIHGIRREPELNRPYFGHIFSEEDKKNLKETGNMGRVVELKTRNGDYAPSLISIDKLTNEIVAMKVENARIPDEIKGIKLDDFEKNELKEGRAIYLEGMISEKGKEFSAKVQFSADRGGVGFHFDNDLSNRNIIGGVELTPKQQEDLNAGKAIFVEDMERKDGEMFSSFIKRDEATGQLSYTRYNSDSPEGAREIYIPKEISGAMVNSEDRDQLRAGRPVFLEGMVNRRGEEFSSFVKVDLETGRLSYSRTIEGFDERQEFKIPAEVWGVTLTATQRAQLQDGKAVLVEGMKGFDGKEFSSYLKANFNQGKLNYFSENPDRRQEASQRNAQSEAQKQSGDAKKDVKKETKQTSRETKREVKKPAGPKMR